MRTTSSTSFTTAAVAASLLAACGGDGSSTPPTSAAQACANVAGQTMVGAVNLTAAVVAASGVAPTYCKVNGTIPPSLNFEVRLPDKWNGKLYYEGGGGFDGSIPPIDGLPTTALNKGYAVAASDSGHQGSVVDASFALDPYARELWGSQSVPTVMSTAVELVTSTYGSRPTRSYFEGCSNGGREGLMAAQRSPNLFDGIVARAPAYNIVGFFGAWNKTNKAQAAPGGQLTTAKVATLAAAVRATCDGLDGVVDGVVSNLTACAAAFDPLVLRCVGGADAGDTCLSDAQLAAVHSRIDPATFGTSPLYPTYTNAGAYFTGNEDDPGAWAQWISGGGNFRNGLQFLLADSFVKYYLARDPTVDSVTYAPYDQDAAALFAASTEADATKTDLSSFRDSGGKLILWQGGADSAFSPRSTEAYYTGVVTAMGGQAQADAFVRSYVAPGVNHCGGGPGADTSDLLEALDQWVTASTPPATLSATKLDATGAVAFSRPLCQYPQYPRYTGPAGNATAVASASNYTCTAP